MNYLIKNATIVNENELRCCDVLIENGIISKIERNIENTKHFSEINAEDLHLFPGAIDDQVHFREPGLTHKGESILKQRQLLPGE